MRRANQRFASTFGGTPDDHRGKGVHDYLPRAEADRVARAPAPGPGDRRLHHRPARHGSVELPLPGGDTQPTDPAEALLSLF
ncbi:hypothetical protein STENM327S_06102 [Streptomyces tendae]